MNNSLFLSIFIIFITFSINACTGDATQKKVELQKEEANPLRIYEPLDVIAFQYKMNEEDVIVLDVRPAYQIKKGKIKNAIEISVLSEDFNAGALKLDKSKTYFVYSRTGRGGITACRRMAGMGFKRLYNLDGGYEAWQRIVLLESDSIK